MSEESHSYELMEDPDNPNLSMSEIVDIVSENARLRSRATAAEAQREAALELARAAQVISDALHGTPMATSEALRELDEALQDWATVRVGPSDLAARLADATNALDALRAERNQLARDLDDTESERDDAEQLLADAQAEVQVLRETLVAVEHLLSDEATLDELVNFDAYFDRVLQHVRTVVAAPPDAGEV